MLRGLSALALGAVMMFEAWGFILPHQDPTDVLILVNKHNRAPSVPITLVKPNVPPTKESISENIYMQPVAARALEELFAGAKEAGHTLLATSGFRSYSTQKAIFERKLETMSEKAANASVAKKRMSQNMGPIAAIISLICRSQMVGVDLEREGSGEKTPACPTGRGG